LDKEFSTEKLKLDLLDKNTEYFFIQEDLKTVGFLKTKYNKSTTFSAENSLKLDKIYVLPDFKGKGIEKLALLKIIENSRKLDVKNIFLGVINTNWGAINFYEQLGFKFHSKTTLDMPYFKQTLKGMNRMVKGLH
jgi:ribosomal protein S18 acetylase RimI-like enzyme